MSLNRYLIIMGIATLVSAGSWLLVVLFLDPTASGVVGVTLFFGSFFLGVFGLCSIIGFVVRHVIQRHETSFRVVAISFRQAGWFAILVTVSLILQSQRLFTVWTAFLLLVMLSLLEAFFVARTASRPRGGSYGT
ncbi:MAG: hypothetical protein HY976_02495 [Candidatus Kerfeldbacteria bacterium]|nr:hypothetical protein [Candidatus Kerfeldbacteria bacterium]